MSTFAEKPKAAQQNQPQKVSSNLARSNTATSGPNHHTYPILHLQHTIGNQAAPSMLQTHAKEPGVGSTARFRHDFSQIPIHPPKAGVIQTKLAINRPGDQYDQEAGSDPHPLESDRSSSESRFGHDFSRVRVQAPQQHALPFLPTIQTLFGRFNVTDVRSTVGGAGAGRSQALGASAYTLGRNVVFRDQPDLFTAAHEAAHVVQQTYRTRDDSEGHADAVARALVEGRSAEALFYRAGAQTFRTNTESSSIRMLRRFAQTTITIPTDRDSFESWLFGWVDDFMVDRRAEARVRVGTNLTDLWSDLEPLRGNRVLIRATFERNRSGTVTAVRVEQPGIVRLPVTEIEGSVPQAPSAPRVRAERTLAILLDQGGLGSGPLRPIEPGEPSIWQHGYVRSRYFSYRANIDMVHFFVVGQYGEELGGLTEFRQQLEGSPSAHQLQDYYSNMLGVDFRNRYYSPEGSLSDQLERFFSDVESCQFSFRLPLREQPSAGVPGSPVLTDADQRRLTDHDSEAMEPAAFVEFVRSLERWIASNPDSAARIPE